MTPPRIIIGPPRAAPTPVAVAIAPPNSKIPATLSNTPPTVSPFLNESIAKYKLTKPPITGIPLRPLEAFLADLLTTLPIGVPAHKSFIPLPSFCILLVNGLIFFAIGSTNLLNAACCTFLGAEAK